MIYQSVTIVISFLRKYCIEGIAIGQLLADVFLRCRISRCFQGFGITAGRTNRKKHLSCSCGYLAGGHGIADHDANP
jgi:hypothetical protein